MLNTAKTVITGPAAMGIANQVIASATNFVITVYLVRLLNPAEFGLWGLGFATVLLILSLTNGLLLTQMVVGLPRRRRFARPAYMRSMLIGTLAVGVGVIGAGLITTAALHWTGGAVMSRGGNEIERLILATSFAAASVILLHYFLRQAFSVGRETTAVILNLVLMGAMGILLITAHQTAGRMTAPIAMMVYGTAHVIAAVVGVWLLPIYRRHLRVGLLKRDLIDAWQHGRWATAGVWVSWGQSQAYVLMTPLFFGLAGLGAVNAARMIAAPLIMLLPAVNQFALPRFSRMHVDRPSLVRPTGMRISLILLICAALYTVIAATGFDWLSNLLLGEQRSDLFWITMAWCLMAGLSLVRQIATVMMQSARQFYALFRYESAVLVVTVAGIWLLSGWLGLSGGIVATAAGECLIAVLVWWHCIATQATGATPVKQIIRRPATVKSN